jgi:hypothetical protein
VRTDDAEFGGGQAELLAEDLNVVDLGDGTRLGGERGLSRDPLDQHVDLVLLALHMLPQYLDRVLRLF